MGSLTLPASGDVYVDAQIVIYSVDRHPVYAAVCDPLWQQVQTGTLLRSVANSLCSKRLSGHFGMGTTCSQHAAKVSGVSQTRSLCR